jgi:3-oxoadipate enol-lactonase/4-carboxymuconolactone decarboxylase
MPFVTVEKTRLYYRVEGKPDSPALILSHSIGADHGMWMQQVEALSPYFRIVRYDVRGHGASDVPQGEYSIEQLGRDVLAIADALSIAKFAFCGLSLGGAIAQWVAIHAPDRLTHLVLANTSPQFGPRSNWETRMRMVREGGMASIVDMVMQRFFSPDVFARDVHASDVKAVFLATDPNGYAGCCAALRDVDHRESLSRIKTPALVIVSDNDVSTPWNGHGEVLAKEIPGAKVVRLPGAHLSNIERPRSFTAALLEHIRPNDITGDVLEAGFKVRRAMLGDAHVDRSIAATTDFNRDFQSLITRYAWGSIWTRPGLSQRTRRLLALAIVASLGRWEEFRMHVRTGVERELELCDLKEVLLQTAVYAGVPAANTGFQAAREEIEKAGKSS